MVPTVLSPWIFTGGQESTAEPAAPAPPAPGCSAHLPKLRTGPNPPAGPGAAPAFPGRCIRRPRTNPSASLLPGGLFLARAGGRSAERAPGRACTRSRRRCRGPSLAERRPRPRKARAPSPAPLPAGALLERFGRASPAPPAGGIGPAGKSFTSPFPSCVLLKPNEKLFRPARFVALARRRRPGRPGARSFAAPPAGIGPFPPPEPPPRPPAGGRGEGICPGKEESGSYGKKDSGFIENFIYDSVL